MGEKSRPGGWVVPAGPSYVSTLDPRDLIVTTFTGATLGMRITHVPSGTTVQGDVESSVYKLRERLMAELEESVNGR
jgi:hypothetical protein